MELGAFLKEIRVHQGHGTIGSLETFAKALGLSISRESLRLFENEKKVPNPATRKLLSDLLRMNVYQKYRFEVLSAEAHIKNKFDLGPSVIIDQETAEQFTNQISTQTRAILEEVLPIDQEATEEDIENVILRLEEICRLILSPKLTQ